MARCRMEKKLVPYAHGALSPRETEQMEQHLARCASCASEMKVLLIMDRFQAVPVPEAASIWPALRQKLAAVKTRPIPWWQTRPALAIGITGIVCAVLVAGSMRFHPHPGIKSPAPKPVVTREHPKTTPIVMASLGDIATGFPGNYISEQIPSRGVPPSNPNPDPQLGGLMVCLGSPLVQSLSPVGSWNENSAADDESIVPGGGIGVDENMKPPTTGPMPLPEGPLQEGDELITNGDFELRRAGLPFGWDSSGAEDSGLRFILDDTISCWGKRSIAIERTADSDDTITNPNNWMQTIFRIPEGRLVHLTAYIRTRDVGLLDRSSAHFSFAAVAVQCWDKDKKRVIAYTSTQTTAGQIQRHTDWTRYNASLRIPEGTGAITVRAMLVGNGRAWFDGISLKVGQEAPETGRELLVNGSFESKDPARIFPLGWFQAQRAAWPGLRFYRDAVIKRTGEASASIINASPRNKGGNNWAQVILNPPAGKKLHLSGFIRSKSDDPDFRVSLGVQCLDTSLNKPIAEESVADDNTAAVPEEEWKRLETSITVPEGTYAVIVRAVARGKGRAWFDDLSLVAE